MLERAKGFRWLEACKQFPVLREALAALGEPAGEMQLAPDSLAT